MVDLNLSNSSAQPEIGAKVEDKKQKVPTLLPQKQSNNE
jgi:hypothetical protein